MATANARKAQDITDAIRRVRELASDDQTRGPVDPIVASKNWFLYYRHAALLLADEVERLRSVDAKRCHQLSDAIARIDELAALLRDAQRPHRSGCSWLLLVRGMPCDCGAAEWNARREKALAGA